MAHFSHSPTSLDFPTMHTPCRVTLPMAPLRSRLRETENKNSTQTATFLRLAIVASLPIADRDTKPQVIRLLSGRFHFARLKNEPLIAKKLPKKSEIFVFHQRADSYDRNETIRKTREIPQQGQKGIPQKSKKAKPTSQPD